MIEPSVRAGNAGAIAAVLQRLGLNVSKLLVDAGFPAEAWSSPEESLSLFAIDRLLVRAEAESGCDHIGFLIGMETADLGLPSYILFNAPDLRTGIGDAVELFSLVNEGGSLRLEESAEDATLRYANTVPMLTAAHHISDCVLGQLQGVLARYCGPKFGALEVRFPRRKPADPKLYSGHFGKARLVFNAEDAAVVLPKEFLDHCSETANPSLYRFLRASQRRTNAPREPLVAQVNRILRFMILDGAVSADELAERVGLDRRTLFRKLRQKGTNLTAMIGDARFDAAKQLLLNTDLSIGKIAHSLGYADAGAMSRAFTRRTGEPPSAHRKNRSPDG